MYAFPHQPGLYGVKWSWTEVLVTEEDKNLSLFPDVLNLNNKIINEIGHNVALIFDRWFQAYYEYVKVYACNWGFFASFQPKDYIYHPKELKLA